MELQRVKVQNFKKISSIDIPLEDVNVLVGTNGSGKSSILQAIHLASCLMRQAARIRSSSTAMVRISDLDYLPSDEYWRLGHGADWGNATTSPSSKVSFHFEDGTGQRVAGECEMRSARNAGISVRGELPEEIRGRFRGAEVFFSGFIPGISGVPNLEQKKSKRVVLKACSFGDSNVYLRNALNLLLDEEVRQIENWLEPLLGLVRLDIKFNEIRDFEITANVNINGQDHPLELLGTGYLQLIQIFCYILLFKPKILLIDEPDIHLHPDVQEKLPRALLKIAKERSLKILLTTHSPFIVRGAPLDAKVIWLSDGRIVSQNREEVELALGWGAFGKKVIVVSEDSKTELLQKLISQWPDIDRQVTVLPGRGYKHLLTKDEAVELYESLGHKFKILVHRDRDSLTDEEVNRLKGEYDDDNIRLWITDRSDIEAEFCRSEIILTLSGVGQEQAEEYIETALGRSTGPIREQFEAQRAAHNQELWRQGGSPTNDEVWEALQARPLRGAKGKTIFRKLKNVIPHNKFREDNIVALVELPELAPGLARNLNDLLME